MLHIGVFCVLGPFFLVNASVVLPTAARLLPTTVPRFVEFIPNRYCEIYSIYPFYPAILQHILQDTCIYDYIDLHIYMHRGR